MNRATAFPPLRSGTEVVVSLAQIRQSLVARFGKQAKGQAVTRAAAVGVHVAGAPGKGTTHFSRPRVAGDPQQPPTVHLCHTCVSFLH